MNKEVIKEIIQGNNLNDLRIITNISKIMDTNEVVYSNYSRKEKVFDDEYFHTDNVEVKEGVLKLTVKRIKESIRFNSTRTAIESRIYTLVGIKTIFIPYENVACIELKEYEKKSICDLSVYDDIPTLDINNTQITIK